MIAVNYSNLRENMKSLFDKVVDDYETLIVTRKNNRNVVVLSEESYNNLLENAYIRSDLANYEWLTDSRKQFEEHKLQKKDL